MNLCLAFLTLSRPSISLKEGSVSPTSVRPTVLGPGLNPGCKAAGDGGGRITGREPAGRGRAAQGSSLLLTRRPPSCGTPSGAHPLQHRGWRMSGAPPWGRRGRKSAGCPGGVWGWEGPRGRLTSCRCRRRRRSGGGRSLYRRPR